MTILDRIAAATSRVTIGGAPEGYDIQLMAEWARKAGCATLIVQDDQAMARAGDILKFFAPDVEYLGFPAWDCLPYDRVSPNVDVLNHRMRALTRLLQSPQSDTPRLILTTVSAYLQRVPPRAALRDRRLRVRKGDVFPREDAIGFLARNGYVRCDTVMEAGEYATRGGILDVFPAGAEKPVRMDFFGDDVDGIRMFDPEDQRTIGDASEVDFIPVSEVFLEEASISRFRTAYREQFGITGSDDPLYESISAGRRYVGMEHWLPLFHENLETLQDYIGVCPVVLSYHAIEAGQARLELIDEYYAARRDVCGGGLASGGVAYHPVPRDTLFLTARDWENSLSKHKGGAFSPFDVPDVTSSGAFQHIDAGGRLGRDFVDFRVQRDVDLFGEVIAHVCKQQDQGRRVVLTALSEGSRDRLRKVLGEHGLRAIVDITSWEDVADLTIGATGLVISGFERGFVTPDFALITEQDILGERMIRPQGRKVKPENIIADATNLNVGDLVVHVEHGIGRFEGLETIKALGAPHDCLQLGYAGGDRLYLPVENIELISRYGSEDAGAQLDRLGGAAWQARKAKMKERIREMADTLIKVAAARELRTGAKIAPQPGAFEEFCARFPYTETEDQMSAIEAVLGDLSSGRNADRLVCGDVGFGKTEVALRAAFATAMDGKQVAIVVPTTLLCRQHFHNFTDRFRDFPVNVTQLSRLVTAKDVKETKAGLELGTVDIVIGTHALLAKDIKFRDLGLLIVDEEQHFGVTHKERLKQIKSDVHVLTLTATPIPRTLQLALTGLREMSLMATPPVDRLAVRTFVLPFDPVIVREAILRERFRGGQTFYVCPRIADIEKVESDLRALVPEISLVSVHGQMPVRELEDRVSAFYDGAFDVMLSTNIIESGLDMPRVNTIIIHRADRFGLAQLYQLRGRVGRSKIRAYAYLTLPPGMKLSATAERRLEVMQTLDHLGAGFSLASHDLDIRGAGNLLGDEQSGHIREVGVELYQQMLEEAVIEARGLDQEGDADGGWSPQINVGIPVLIPDTYIADLPVRMGLYRRIALLDSRKEIDALAAEMIDRFGTLPEEAENLLETVAIKSLCRHANVEKVDAGPKGAVVSFRNNEFANPGALIEFIQDHQGTAKLRPDHSLVYMRSWDDPDTRLSGVRFLLKSFVDMVDAAPA